MFIWKSPPILITQDSVRFSSELLSSELHHSQCLVLFLVTYIPSSVFLPSLLSRCEVSPALKMVPMHTGLETNSEVNMHTAQAYVTEYAVETRKPRLDHTVLSAPEYLPSWTRYLLYSFIFHKYFFKTCRFFFSICKYQ